MHLCSQHVRFCINRVSFPPLIIPCAFMLTGSVYLHSQSHTTIADYPLHIAHRFCVLLIILHYLHCPHHALSLFLLVGVWLSHMTRDHSINLAYLMCLQKVCITIIPHLFTGSIPQYTSRRYVQSHMLSLH